MTYRTLHEIEERDRIASYEGEKSLGPQRRVYHLVEAGRRHLDIWAEDLRRAKREIDWCVR
jgi:DNA-binding PadR family transcriptional regulator